MDSTRLDPDAAKEQKTSTNPEVSLLAENAAAEASSLGRQPSVNAFRNPKARGPRKLVLCFDGTGNKFHGDDSDSNILKIFRMLDRTADDQYHYYQPGIGTYVVSDSLSHTGLSSRISSWYTKAKDSAIGSSFDQHVVGGYRFLMRFYNPGDEIYMFGFSRGAYIARFLAEMLDYIGLLSHGNEEMVKFAWKAFSQWQCRPQSTGSDENISKAEAEKNRMFDFMKGFRETFSRPVGRIKFLGLFDTVNSVPRFETAWMQRSKFPYTARSSAMVIRHAVSIDERRAKFRQDLMYQQKPKHSHRHIHLSDIMDPESWNNAGHHLRDMMSYGGEAQTEGGNAEKDRGRPRDKFLSPNAAAQPQNPGGRTFAPYRIRSASRRRMRSRQRGQVEDCASVTSGLDVSDIQDWDIDDDDTPQSIEEVWFAGGHGDVGGGWEMLKESKSASHVPLAWIVREAMRAGLPFDPEKVAEMGCACAAEWENGNPSRRAAEAKELQKEAQKQRKKRGEALNIPDIRMDNGTEPAIPESPAMGSDAAQKKPAGGDVADDDDDDDDDDDHHESSFRELMSKAHTARIHDSLAFGGGLNHAAVAAWNFMEYLPFRRMDLQSDGSWEPIRWPLPRGEVRDIPDNVRVHGSVIRRLKEDKNYRPGNLIIGGGGRGLKKAPEKHGIGDWECVAEPGDAIGEIWVRKTDPTNGGANGQKANGKEE